MRMSRTVGVIVVLSLLGWCCEHEIALAAQQKCQNANCQKGCVPLLGWCFTGAGGSTCTLYQKNVVHPTYCTDAAVGGTPAVNGLVFYDEYNNCTPDCPFPKDAFSSGAQAGTKQNKAPLMTTIKTQCNNQGGGGGTGKSGGPSNTGQPGGP